MQKSTTLILIGIVGCAANPGGERRDSGVDASTDAVIKEECETLADRPSQLSEHTAVLDQKRGQLIVFGGSIAAAEMCDFPEAEYVDELWLLDERCATWRNATVKGKGPSARGRHMAAWDPVGRRMVIFGGRQSLGNSEYEPYNDLWAWSAADESWELLHDGSDPAPAPRHNGALAYDVESDSLWLFGGDAASSGTDGQPLDDTWQFSPVNDDGWTEITSAAPPHARLQSAYAVDGDGRRLLLFGGRIDFLTYLDDLWALSFEKAAWEELEPHGGPSNRFFGAAVFDAGRFVLFGGHDDGAVGNRNDWWTWDEEHAWLQVTDGDALKQEPSDFCDIPKNFTTTDVALPERRSAHAFAAADGQAWIMGGKTDCGAVDDAWRVDLAAQTLQEVIPATVGESCVRRSDGDLSQCTRLCF